MKHPLEKVMQVIPELFVPDGNIHVVPTSGQEHIEHPSCWCHPVRSYKDTFSDTEVWTHNGYEEINQ